MTMKLATKVCAGLASQWRLVGILELYNMPSTVHLVLHLKL